MFDFCFSQDLGKLADPSAYVLTETKTRVRTEPNEVREFGEEPETEILYPDITVRWVARKMVPYDQVIDDAYDRLHDVRLLQNCSHLIDITGVGQPVWDMMVRRGMSPIGISFTSGLQVHPAPYGFTVPKIEMLSALQLALRQKALKFSNGLDQEIVDQIIHEFASFRDKRPEGKSLESWREKDHDDIIFALAMNVWWIYRTRGVQVIRKRQFSTASDYDPLRYGL